MRPELPDILRAIAQDFDISGSQYATLAALMREAARELQELSAQLSGLSASGVPSVASPPAAHIAFDDDGVPVRVTCVNCED